ncbi:tRNA (1-methyladenosine) methyltransferase catalytic subunit Gcd14, partial [Kipferlia bialata]
SGCLTHYFLNAVAVSDELAALGVPQGHVYTYDINAERAADAKEEFVQHGYGDVVTVTHRDVCRLNYHVEGDTLPPPAHSAFLDMPEPWLAVPHLKDRLVEGGRLVVFSPGIEQVQQVCSLLRGTEGWAAPETSEAVLRQWFVHRRPLMQPALMPNPEPVGHARLQHMADFPLLEKGDNYRSHTGYLTVCVRVPEMPTDQSLRPVIEEMNRRSRSRSARLRKPRHPTASVDPVTPIVTEQSETDRSRMSHTP